MEVSDGSLWPRLNSAHLRDDQKQLNANSLPDSGILNNDNRRKAREPIFRSGWQIFRPENRDFYGKQAKFEILL